MHVAGLWVQHYRNFSDRHWEFSPGLNVISAPNGSGKTNIIEAITLLSQGSSWRAQKTDELIAWDEPLAHVQAKVLTVSQEDLKLEQMYTRGSLHGRRTQKRLYKVNGVNRRSQDAVGKLLTVLFTPEDMSLFQAGPAARRRLLDELLTQAFPKYRYAHHQYEQVLKRRNRLLKRIKEGEAQRSELFLWDRLLIEHGEHMHAQRQAFLEWLNQHSDESEADPARTEDYHFSYDHSVVSVDRLEQYAFAEVAAGYTLVGPHKDDVVFEFRRAGEWRNIESYGSRGEQRMALVWWKLMELQFLKQHTDDTPVLLLDDVYSELDEANQARLTDQSQVGQVILTTADTRVSPRFFSVDI